ncbi:UNVERIFIED_CONTAM: hypothetical protein GTU68_052089 [Idotea baltica]|nr:hypothetical protein [Idotea baltica]
MVAAQTGTGKTGGFALPILEKLFPNGQVVHQATELKALILTPTRELAAQIHNSFKLYAKNLPLSSTCIFGGVGANPQIKALAQGVDVLVACPGRLLDLIGQGKVDLSKIQTLVLDEADKMLDMGFVHDVKKILKLLPEQRQNLLFSATFSKDIAALAQSFLSDPIRFDVTPPNTTVERIKQRVFRLPSRVKRAFLAHIIKTENWEQVLVFTRTKHGANRLSEYLEKNSLPSVAIHGNKSQNARTRALNDFKMNKVRVLVATDIAARGLDIDQLPHVVNFELPNIEEDYVHRIGRTGRAGHDGEAISLVAPEEEKLIRNIERTISQKIPAGEIIGFDINAVADASEARNTRPAKPARNRPPQARKTTTNTTKHENNTRATPHNKNATDRAPDEFRDDDDDNFGNRIDYVSPHTQKTPGQNRSPYFKNTSTKRAASANTNRTRANNPNRSTTSGRTATSKSRGGPSAQKRRPFSRMDDRPLADPASHSRSSTNNSTTKKPLILHKNSRSERLQMLEQAEQLTTKRLSKEKPSLLIPIDKQDN